MNEITIENNGDFIVENVVITDLLEDPNLLSNSFNFISLVDSNDDPVAPGDYSIDESNNIMYYHEGSRTHPRHVKALQMAWENDWYVLKKETLMTIADIEKALGIKNLKITK